MTVGWITFGRDDFSYGLALCIAQCDHRHRYRRVTPRTAANCDVILFSLFWWEHIYCLVDFLIKANVKKGNGRPVLIAGGFNSFNPVPIAAFVDYVVVGDGEETLGPLLDAVENKTDIPAGVYVEGQKAVDWQNVASMKTHAHQTGGITRIEIARGCKSRCRFCAVGHLKPYREVAYLEICGLLDRAETKRVSLFSPEPTYHSEYDKIERAMKRRGLSGQESDVRLDRLKRFKSPSVPRIGLEGLSERLRLLVGKKIRNDQVIDAVRYLISIGRGGLFVYIILDLPSENQDDYAEFRELLGEIGKVPGADKFLLKPSPSVFLPNPHTPMEKEPIHWRAPLRDQWKELFGRGDQRQWDLVVAERTRIFSPHSRLLSMISVRGGVECKKLIPALMLNGAVAISGGRTSVKSVDDLERLCDKFGHGADGYCGVPVETPWKVVRMPE